MSRLLMAVLVLVATAAGGWLARGWLEDSQRLNAMQVAEAAIDAAMARESDIARRVEERLAGLKASERVIDRGIIREIEKPVYQRVCLEPDLVRLLNHAAAGTAPDPADAVIPLPGLSTPAD